jgi:hypothetical protein
VRCGHQAPAMLCNDEGVACADGVYATAPGVRRRCKQAVFTKLFHRMIQTCKVKEAAMKRLHALFTPHPHIMAGPVLPEVALTLWAFPPSPDAWSATVKLLVQTLRPRVYATAETRQGQQEVFMVVCTKPLRTTPDMFEQWINVFAEHIGMSAGHVCFGEYFGEQMIGSMMRIKQQFTAFHSFHTMPNPYDRDFIMLYGALAQKRRIETDARDMTGKDFTLSNFIQLHMQNIRLATQLRQQAKDKQAWAQRRSKLTRMICALGHVNAINMDTWKELLCLVGEVPEHTTPETFRLYTAFAQAQSDADGSEVASREPLPRPSLQQTPPHADTLSRAVEQEEAGDAVDDNDMMEMLRSWHSRGLAVD